jgi:hypothetical protein
MGLWISELGDRLAGLEECEKSLRLGGQLETPGSGRRTIFYLNPRVNVLLKDSM